MQMLFLKILVGQRREGGACSESPQLAVAPRCNKNHILHEFSCLSCGGPVILRLNEYRDGTIWASGNPTCPHCGADFRGGTIARMLSQRLIIKIFGPRLGYFYPLPQ